MPKNTQDEIIKLSKKVILELPDKMSEYLLKNKLEGLPDKLSTLNTFYMYMSGSGNEAANNLNRLQTQWVGMVGKILRYAWLVF